MLKNKIKFTLSGSVRVLMYVGGGGGVTPRAGQGTIQGLDSRGESATASAGQGPRDRDIRKVMVRFDFAHRSPCRGPDIAAALSKRL